MHSEDDYGWDSEMEALATKIYGEGSSKVLFFSLYIAFMSNLQGNLYGSMYDDAYINRKLKFERDNVFKEMDKQVVDITFNVVEEYKLEPTDEFFVDDSRIEIGLFINGMSDEEV
jgi:hypothetical protein